MNKQKQIQIMLPRCIIPAGIPAQSYFLRLKTNKDNKLIFTHIRKKMKQIGDKRRKLQLQKICYIRQISYLYTVFILKTR